jgi:sulfur carrier protein
MTRVQTLLVQVNGESRELRAGSTLDDLVIGLSLTPARIAIELNQSVVRRDHWADTTLSEGDRIEMVHFVGGGTPESKG